MTATAPSSNPDGSVEVLYAAELVLARIQQS